MMTHVIFIYNGTLQMSNPSSGLRFHWVFNTTAATQAQPSPGGGAGGGAVKVEGTRSVVDYTPRTELDYGHLVCWAENSIGPQVGRDTEKIFRCSRKNISPSALPARTTSSPRARRTRCTTAPSSTRLSPASRSSAARASTGASSSCSNWR